MFKKIKNFLCVTSAIFPLIYALIINDYNKEKEKMQIVKEEIELIFRDDSLSSLERQSLVQSVYLKHNLLTNEQIAEPAAVSENFWENEENYDEKSEQLKKRYDNKEEYDKTTKK